MISKEQAQVIADLRHAQAMYFRTRSPFMLERAKELEKKVDGYIRSWILSGAIHDPVAKINPGKQSTFF